jgi:hypothetical protein
MWRAGRKSPSGRGSARHSRSARPSHRLDRHPVRRLAVRTGVQFMALVVVLLTAVGIAGNQTTSRDRSIAIADAYTDLAQPTATHGDASRIVVSSQAGKQRVGYVKFDVGRLPDNAVPRLVLTVDGDAGKLEVHATEIEWDERDLSPSNAPATDGLLSVVNVPAGLHRLVMDVPEFIGRDGVYSFALIRAVDRGETEVLATESGSTQVPRLQTEPPPPEATTVVRPTPTNPHASDDPAGHQSSSPSESKSSDSSSPSQSPSASPTTGACTVSRKLVPSCGVWFGASAYPLAGESFDRAIMDFERTVRRPLDIAHYYQRGQSVLFPTSGEMSRANEPGRHRLLYLNWKPTGLTWRQIADGAADGFLSRLGAHIRATHPEPFFLSLNAEMEDEVTATAGSGRTAADFRSFFRHTVQTLRAAGADNVVFVVNYTSTPHWADKPWFDTLYPGDDVVDWIAEDPYAVGRADDPVWRTDFPGLVNRRQNPTGSDYPGFYSWAQRDHPSKPIMLGEWGVDDPADDPTYKPRFFANAGEQLSQFPKLKALVYWNAADFPVVGDTRVDSSSQTLAAVRDFVSLSTLTRPGGYYLR